MRRIGLLVPVLALACGAGASCARLGLSAAAKGKELDAALQQLIQSQTRPGYVTGDREGSRLWTLTRRFYEKRGLSPAWIADAKPQPQMDALVTAIHESSREGLDPELYSISLIDREKTEASRGLLLKKGFQPEEGAAIDVWLTYFYMRFASDLADGMADLAHADPAWQIRADGFDPLAYLERALAENRVAESLSELTPADPEYDALRKLLASLRDRAAQGGWSRVPSVTLKPGQHNVAVMALTKRLAESGDYSGGPAADAKSAAYTPDLVEAVKRFQRRHGLADDGIVGPPVIAALNVPIDQRIRQIELNMERWRWLPRHLGDRHILVNIPEMRLDVRDHGRSVLSMRVVVGKRETPTPIFNDEMTYIVFSPYWNVPPDIAANETLPETLKDPAFLNRMNMEVVNAAGNTLDPSTIDLSQPGEYRFRQRPGHGNSLGLVKFMFPNQFNVYLHDTPTDSLFARASRSFSHGCVRLEAPEKLAQYLLSDQPDWTSDRISEAMHAGQERTVKLRRPIPVYLGYWTVRVAADGMVQFRNDVYGIDGRQSAQLADRLNTLRRSAPLTQASTKPGAKTPRRSAVRAQTSPGGRQ